MLTSFFGKSSPINYILLSIAIVIGYFMAIRMFQEASLSLDSFPNHLATVLLMVFAVLLLDFIIRKNNVTKNNTFTILLFVLFVLLVPQVYFDIQLVIANVFILLATRRILSLTTEKNIEKKIFDATMYITLASLCYGWSILFFLVLYPSIIRKTKASIQFLVIPILGFLGISTLAVTYQLLVSNSFEWMRHWFSEISFDFSAYNTLSVLIPATVICTLFVWTGTTRAVKLSSLSKKEKPSAITMVLVTIISICIALASPEKNGGELFFVFAPVAAITTNYIETANSKERHIFNEVLLWILIFLVFIVAIL